MNTDNNMLTYGEIEPPVSAPFRQDLHVAIGHNMCETKPVIFLMYTVTGDSKVKDIGWMTFSEYEPKRDIELAPTIVRRLKIVACC